MSTVKVIKKAEFSELVDTLISVCHSIDELLIKAREEKKGNMIWHGHKNFKAFIKHIESEAIKKSAKELKLGETTVRDRFRVLTLPYPVYAAMECGDITFSKAKQLTAINFDFDDINDAKVAQEIVDGIKTGISEKEIKELVKSRSKEVWHQGDVVVHRIAEQNKVSEKTLCY